MENQASQNIIVKGMHCNACIAMITMQLEDKGLMELTKSISLIKGENKGIVEIYSNDQNITAIKDAIESAGEYECE